MKGQIQKKCFNKYFLFVAVCLGFLAVAGATNANGNTTADFDGDGKADISVFRPSNGFWYIAKSSGGFMSVQWGQADDTLVPGDYDGDGKTDTAVYRIGPPSSNPPDRDYIWHIRQSSDNAFLARPWGRYLGLLGSHTPRPADYDGDGKTDLTIYFLSDFIGSPSSFGILKSSTNLPNTIQWGLNTDSFIPGDYDGDGKADLAVYRANELGFFGAEVNAWFILNSSNNTVRVEKFGLTSDRRIPADYDGDGKTDIAVFRPSNGFWYRINSRDGSFSAQLFGQAADKLVPADYDGDGRTDLGVFRPSNGVWYLQRSTAGFAAQQFGLSDDIPIPNIFVR